jgi:hypothetical protein
MKRLGLQAWGGASALLLASFAAFAAACSSSSSNTGTTSGGLGTDGGNTGVAENFDAAFDGQTSLNLKWLITEQPAIGYGYGDAGGLNSGADGGMSPIAGVKVCVYQNTAIPCATSAADGTFTLGNLPPRTNMTLSFTADGYVPILKAIQTASSDMDGTSNPVRMTLSSDPDPNLGGVTIDWTNKGQLAFFALGPQPDASSTLSADVGATVALSPSAGNGPYYLDGNGDFDLTATSLLSGGVGYYYNLPAGNYTLTFTDHVNNCAPLDVFFAGYGWPDPPTSVQFPIVAGYVTELVGVLCTVKPALVEAGP